MMSDVPTKGGNLPYVITHSIVWTNQKTDVFLYHLLTAHALFDVTCFLTLLEHQTSFQALC